MRHQSSNLFAHISQRNLLRLALLSVYPEMVSRIPILLAPSFSLCLSPYVSHWEWLQCSCVVELQPSLVTICVPVLNPAGENFFSVLADSWSFMMLKYWHEFCCDFVLRFDIGLYSQFGIELEKMRILGSWFFKLLIFYQRHHSKMLQGEERVLFHSALLTNLHTLLWKA